MADVITSVEALLDFVDLPEDEEIEETLDEELEEELEEDLEEEESEEEESEDDEEESEEEESEVVEDPLFDIVIDGEEYEVNLEELKSGYLRQEELVKAKVELEELVSNKEYELLSEREKLIENYNQLILEDGVNLEQFKNIDWERFRQQDPEQYREWRIRYVEAQEVLQRKVARRDQIAAIHNKQQELRHQAYVSQQAKLAKELIPEIEQDDFIDSLVAYGESVGFTKEEILNIADAKSLFVLKQAMENSKASAARQAALEKRTKVVPKVVKPGQRTSQADETRGKQNQLRAKLNTTHSMKDAAAVLLDFV